MPRISDQFLSGKEYLRILQADNLGPDRIADPVKVRRIVYSLPGQFGNMDKALQVLAEADENPEVGDRRDLPLYGRTNFIFRDNVLLFFVPGFFFRKNYLVIFFLKGDYFYFKFLARERAQFVQDLALVSAGNARIILRRQLRHRQKARDLTIRTLMIFLFS